MSSSLAAIHVAKKKLGLDDDTYRAKLTHITGKASTKDMTEQERQRVLAVFRNEGFQPAPSASRPNGRAKLTGRFASKLQSLWIACYNLGIVANRDDAAVAFLTALAEFTFFRFWVSKFRKIAASYSRTSKLLSIPSGTNGSGGGIRTPDTRIMIPLL